MAQIFPTDFEEKLTMAQDDYILFSDSEDGNKIKKAQYKNLKGEKGDTGARINSASFSGNDIVFGETDGNSVTLANAKTTLTGPKGEDGDDGAAATITVGTTITGDAGTSASVTNSGTSSAAILNFTIPKGEKGDGDVIGPASSTDGDIVLFDGVTGKQIKDGSKSLNDLVQTSGNQTINGTKTFSTSPVVPSKSTDATNTGTAIATEAQVYNVAQDVATINGKIPSAATSSNQLADKNYVDDGINSVTAYYITKNAQGDQWATYTELAAASTFYSGGVARTPTRNDYTIVLADENHDNATTRYIYNSGWEYQYTVNETALSQAQLDALNSGITSGKVSTYDGYATTISGKQDALTLPATPTQGNLVTWGANNKTLVDGGAVPTVPTNVSSFVNDAGYLTSETVVSGDSGVTYTIKKSATAPSGADSNTVTLVV